MFQGPAERHPFVPSRLGWRLYWDYGGGSISDWGVHLTDVMLWYMNADRKTPLLTSASAVNAFNQPDPERVPDSYSITWKFDNFVATLTNAVPPSGGLGRSEMYGDWFYGQKGVFQVNRFGYELRPVLQAPGHGRSPCATWKPGSTRRCAPGSAVDSPRAYLHMGRDDGQAGIGPLFPGDSVEGMDLKRFSLELSPGVRSSATRTPPATSSPGRPSALRWTALPRPEAGLPAQSPLE